MISSRKLMSMRVSLELLSRTLMNARTDTGSKTIESGMRELTLHRGILKRAQNKLDLVVGADRAVQESGIPNLPYLQAIVKETSRLHTVVASSLPQQSIHASNDVLGYNFPTHTHLILNLHVIHRNPPKRLRESRHIQPGPVSGKPASGREPDTEDRFI